MRFHFDPRKSSRLRNNPKRVRENLLCIWRRFGVQHEKRGNCMKSTRKKDKAVSAESIARLAERGKNVSRFFTNAGRMVEPIQRVNVDFTAGMLRELDDAAEELNISRQAVLKTLVRHGLDRQNWSK